MSEPTSSSYSCPTTGCSCAAGRKFGWLGGVAPHRGGTSITGLPAPFCTSAHVEYHKAESRGVPGKVRCSIASPSALLLQNQTAPCACLACLEAQNNSHRQHFSSVPDLLGLDTCALPGGGVTAPGEHLVTSAMMPASSDCSMLLPGQQVMTANFTVIFKHSTARQQLATHAYMLCLYLLQLPSDQLRQRAGAL